MICDILCISQASNRNHTFRFGGFGLFDSVLLAAILLLLATFVASLLFYRRIRRLREEYEEAKDVVGDVVISFNKQLQREEDRIGAVAHETQMLSSNMEKTTKKVEEHDRLLAKLSEREAVSEIDQKITAQIDTVNKRIDDVITTQTKITQKIAELESLGHEVLGVPESKIEAAIPIKRERALAPLTPTELSVLEILASEGAKTGLEIRERIQLTREHTARLMKKLYEEGYLERDTEKMPYAYRVKKEMLKILQKAEEVA